MYKLLSYCCLAAILLLSSYCSPKQSEIVVAEFGEHQIKMDEFEKAYVKNVGSLEKAKEDSLADLEKFLDLYVNFKMKLRDAYVRDLHNDSNIITELNNYEKTIGASYLLEKELIGKGVKELYKMRSEELRVSHLLIRTDSLNNEQAEAKAMEIIDRIKNGASFEEEVKIHSQDQFSKDKGGDIYYITAGMIMPSFEEMTYKTKVGEVNPQPLKTRYGYHILKVTDRRKRIPQIRASHILIQKEDAGDSNNTSKGLQFAEEILKRARSGEDFGELAKEYSNDPGSKEKGGDLGFFERRRMVQPFDEAAFNLEVGEISDIVESRFGYHIIKQTERIEYPDFEVEEKNLRRMYEETRRKLEYEELINDYASQLNYKPYQSVVDTLISSIEEGTYDESYWESNLSMKLGKMHLFSIGENKFSVDSLFSFGINSESRSGNVITTNNVKNLIKEFKEQKILEAKAGDLAKVDSNFAQLMSEYKNGILIFRLQEDEVWNKMKMDSTEIHMLYEDTKEKYRYVDRVRYSELYSKEEEGIKELLNQLNNGIDFDSLVIKHNDKASIANLAKDKPIHATFNILSKEAFKLENPGDYSGIIENSGKWSIVRLEEKLPARLKTFDEARAEITSEYQDIESKQLEAEYIAKLKKRYQPKVYHEELKYAYTN
ncbi:MAG: peptidylprolyl isomerase [Melioribacteraceae bacterium]|nr:peptidylprolyl isomerase [Melioribacteraceae bacterium]